MFKNLRFTTSDLLIFALPMILGQLGQMLIGFGDSLIAAKYSTDTVAAVGIALGFINPFFLFGIGILNSLSPKLAMKRGEGKNIDEHLNDAFYLSLIVFIFVGIVTYNVTKIIPYAGIDEKLIPLINKYIEIILWSFWPAYIFQITKEFLQAKEKVYFPNIVSIVFVLVNVFLNYLMVFGKWGFSEQGIAGTANASIIVRVLMALTMLFYLRFIPKLRCNFNFIFEVLKFGFPVGLMFLFEVSAFCLVSILSGGFGVTEAASNTISLNLGSLAFMIPLSLGFASSVKIGKYYGMKDKGKLKDYIGASLFVTLLVVIFNSTCFFLFPQFFIGLFTDDIAVVALATYLFIILGIFQVFDGFQAVLGGVLRGLHVTKELTYVATIGYWVVGIPFGLFLAYKRDLTTVGLWVGLLVSLFFMSVSMAILLIKKLNKIEKTF